jgi:hypothetical protein
MEKLDEQKTKETLTSIFSGIFSAMDKEAGQFINDLVSTHPEMQEITDKIYSVEDFYFKLIYPYNERFLRGLMLRQKKWQVSSDAEFILLHSRYIDLHFEKLFNQFEGLFACADKSRTIVQRLFDFYAKGEKIKFNKKAKYTYGHPKKIFTTHEEIVNFYEGLRDLYHGNPTKYLQAMLELKKITDQIK